MVGLSSNQSCMEKQFAVSVTDRHSVSGDSGFLAGNDQMREGYIFVAAIYFVSSFVMSRYSQWLEKRIGAGAKTR